MLGLVCPLRSPTRWDAATETDSDFLVVCERGLVSARVNHIKLRRRDIAAVWAPRTGEANYIGCTGAGIISPRVRNASLVVPTFQVLKSAPSLIRGGPFVHLILLVTV